VCSRCHCMWWCMWWRVAPEAVLRAGTHDASVMQACSTTIPPPDACRVRLAVRGISNALGVPQSVSLSPQLVDVHVLLCRSAMPANHHQRDAMGKATVLLFYYARRSDVISVAYLTLLYSSATLCELKKKDGRALCSLLSLSFSSLSAHTGTATRGASCRHIYCGCPICPICPMWLPHLLPIPHLLRLPGGGWFARPVCACASICSI
jgi:hypothetical protein